MKSGVTEMNFGEIKSFLQGTSLFDVKPGNGPQSSAANDKPGAGHGVANLQSSSMAAIFKRSESTTLSFSVLNNVVGEKLAALDALADEYMARGIELREVSSGFRIQVRQAYTEALRPLWSERPSRYTRALLETLALIAYRQPITRGEIEDIRGVTVSSSIVKTLLEREWVRVVGHRDVPGKPAMYGTTRQFLDYFNLKSLNELPTLAEIRDLDQFNPEFAFEEDKGVAVAASSGDAGPEAEKAPQTGDDSEVEQVSAD